MDRSYHRAAYEHHRAKAAAYRSKAEGHLARASAHRSSARSRLGFGMGAPTKPPIWVSERPCGCGCNDVRTGACPCGCKGDTPCEAQLAFDAATTHDKVQQASLAYQQILDKIKPPRATAHDESEMANLGYQELIDKITVHQDAPDHERKVCFRRVSMISLMRERGLAYFRTNAEKVPSSLELYSENPPAVQDMTWRELLSEMFGITI
jgi:hypothetical protein